MIPIDSPVVVDFQLGKYNIIFSKSKIMIIQTWLNIHNNWNISKLDMLYPLVVISRHSEHFPQLEFPPMTMYHSSSTPSKSILDPQPLVPESEAKFQAKSGMTTFHKLHVCLNMDVGQNGRPRGPQMLV